MDFSRIKTREPAQSKRTWTCHENHFMREFTRTMPGTKIGTHHLCEPAQSKCTWASHKRKNAGHQNPDAQFVRACAIEMHMDKSQELFYARIHKNNAGHQDRDVQFERACAIETHTDKSQELFFWRDFTRTMPGIKIGKHSLSEPAQFKRTRTSHKSYFMREFTRTMPGTEIGRHSLREPAQSKRTWTSHKWKNARHQDRDAQFARAYAIEMHL